MELSSINSTSSRLPERHRHVTKACQAKVGSLRNQTASSSICLFAPPTCAPARLRLDRDRSNGVDIPSRARVAELVDALVSGTSGGNTVGVRVPPFAQQNKLPTVEVAGKAPRAVSPARPHTAPMAKPWCEGATKTRHAFPCQSPSRDVSDKIDRGRRRRPHDHGSRRQSQTGAPSPQRNRTA